MLAQLRATVAEFTDEASAARMLRSLKPLLKMKTERELPGEGAADHEIEDPPSGELYATIIVVDPDVKVRANIVRWLRAARYNAVSAPSPEVALAMCVRTRPDVVIADTDAVNVSGQKLSALLTVAFGNKAPPLVMLTSGDVAEREATATIDKPVERNALLDTIKSLIPV